jgi:hypothetical protein
MTPKDVADTGATVANLHQGIGQGSVAWPGHTGVEEGLLNPYIDWPFDPASVYGARFSTKMCSRGVPFEFRAFSPLAAWPCACDQCSSRVFAASYRYRRKLRPNT